VTVLSTYRLQLRGPNSGQAFTFDDAEQQLDYLDDLGITHLYLSPILTAAEGSTHGYDVVDPTTVSAALGGPEGLARLSAAARAHGMGLIVDIVPNHVGVDDPRQNRWWWDLLERGRDSAYCSYFDIDWELDPDGRIVLPVLGSDDDVDDLVVDGEGLRLGDRCWPVAPGTGAGSALDVYQRQNYKLIGWRNNVCGYRRFFSITSLAGLRQEDRAVFDATHVEVKRWFDEGLVDGIRIDHPDGLTDPPGYLAWLRELTGPDAWIVIEKILAPDEPLDLTLPVAGTTGYDALREIGGLFVDPNGRGALDALVDSAWGDHVHSVAGTNAAGTAQAKEIAATYTLTSELNRLRRAVVATAGGDHPLLPDAITLLLTNIHVYRCDYPVLAAMMSTALAETAAARPELSAPLELLSVALEHPEPAARLQQLCGAVTAKAVEDSLFYRDPTLVSLNEVGGEPGRFGVSAAEFHHSAAVRSRHWPTAMTTLSTHDTKRGEDVRARIGVLSQVPGLWTELIAQWEGLTPGPDAQLDLFLLQNLFGVWPADGAVTDELRKRLHGYAEKAVREGGIHSRWSDPDDGFEGTLRAWLDAVIDGPVAVELTALVARLDPYGRSDALGQKLIQLTAPGIPDVYQGTELWDDSLVDPDNRRPVDYTSRHDALGALEHPKMRVTTAALRLRRERPEDFVAGGYLPLRAEGTAHQHVVAFTRGDDVLVAASRWTVPLDETGWGDTALDLPHGDWTDRLTDRAWTGRVAVAGLFGELPVALLERTGG
jgi:(1->4)-alpha-D-glucan 1-alpha-D-glucosylmutase